MIEKYKEKRLWYIFWILLVVLGINLVSVDVKAEEETAEISWKVSSPDGKISANLILDKNGSLKYDVLKDRQTIVADGTLGVWTSLGDFTENLSSTGEAERKSIRETYSVLSGKASEYQNYANQLTISFMQNEQTDVIMQVVFRAYDDGFAYCYKLCSESKRDIRINGETGSFCLPYNTKTVSMESTDGGFSHEGTYSVQNAGNLNGKVVFPFLYQLGDTWVLMNEAALNNSYSGCVLDVRDSVFTVGYPHQQGDFVTTQAPLDIPWRYMVIGSISDIMENTMAENLSPAPDSSFEFEKWVRPGTAAWTWMAGGFSMQRDPEAIKKYLDLSKDMGWNYFIMDEGWQPNNPEYGQEGASKYKGYFDWFDEIVQYAAKRDVGLIAWVPCDDLNTPEKRAERLPEWAEKGIRGIKVDFFDRESQDRIALMQDIYRDCAEYRLLVNVHGTNKPTGEIRTYPNLLTREAVRGEEMDSNSYEQMVLAPVIRGSVGPTDYTPRIEPYGASDLTYAHQLAVSILFESGLPCMASDEYKYRNLAGADFLRGLPAKWDETKGLDSVPGAYLTIARRSKNTWYLASNQGEGGRTANISLDFLGEGTYIAEIFTDKEDGRDVECSVRLVTESDCIRVKLKQGGAVVVRMTKAAEPDRIRIRERETVLEENESIQLTLETPSGLDPSSILWETDNDEIAVVSRGKVKARGEGIVTVTARSGIDHSVFDSCKIAVLGRAETAQNWNIINNNGQFLLKRDWPKQVTIHSQDGDFAYGNTPNNKFSMHLPKGDFDLSVKVNADLAADYQTAALYVENEDGAMFTAQRRCHHGIGADSEGQIFAAPYRTDFNADLDETQLVSALGISKDFYLKITKRENRFCAYYSTDGNSWILIAENIDLECNWDTGASAGVFVCNGLGQQTGTSVTFENFTCNETVYPFCRIPRNRILFVREHSEITVEKGAGADDLNLPDEVSCYLSDGTWKNAKVVWNMETYDAEKAGRQMLTGTLLDIPGALNSYGVKAEIGIFVKDGAELPNPPETEGEQNPLDKEENGQKTETVFRSGILEYEITKSDSKTGTVSVKRLLDKKKAKIVIPETVQKDGVAFQVTAIQEQAFQKNKKITDVVIGRNVAKIEAKSFFKCKKLKSITFKGTNVPKIGNKAFGKIKANCKITTPKKMSKKDLKKLKKAMKSAGKKVIWKKA